jgi:TonB family protein
MRCGKKEGSMKQILAAVLVVGGLAAVLDAQEVFNVGNGVRAPTVVSQVKPDYTPQAQTARIQGAVLMNVVVLADGAVGTVAVERSLDTMFGLDEQAVKAMKRWTFKPGTKDGKAVAVRVHVEMTFTLK